MINIGVGALIFSIWLIVLFFGKAIGLSMLLFVIPFSCFFIYILGKNNKIKKPKVAILLVPIILLSSTYFIFDNVFFNFMNLMVIPTLYSIMILGLMGENFEINFGAVGKIICSFLTPFKFILDGIASFINCLKQKLKIDSGLENKERNKKIAKAIITTIPIVFIIMMLLSSADEIFASIFKGVFIKIMSISCLKIIYTALAFCYFIGLFYYSCLKYENTDKKLDSKTKINNDFTMKMILVSLNIIYLLFCCIQVKALFMKSTILNYAQYARQGFFQLMIVSIINLVTILISKKKENGYENNTFTRCMSLIMIVFTFIIVISAGMRMYFYESAYGYTLLRLLVYCVLLIESILFIPTILYIIGKKIDLVKSYFTIVVVMYVCMNFANFDNIIVKRNVDRYVETGKIDFNYIKIVPRYDAINQILRLLEVAKDGDDIKIQTDQYIKRKYEELNQEDMDFRDYNISRRFAKNLIANKIKVR